MKTNLYKLIVTDLDGTLLDDNGLISDDNRHAVARAAAMGVRTVISSGRSYMSIKYFEEQLGLIREDNYGICFNGGIVYETTTRKKLLEHRLDRHIAREIIEKLRAFPVDIMAYLDRELIAEKETSEIFAYRDRSRIPITVIEDFNQIGEDFSKILLKGSFDNLSEVARHMASQSEGRYSMFFSSKNLLEFCCPDVNKGTGLLFLLDYLGIDPSECIAMGDQENDIPMLTVAGMGVAVRNAEPAVHKAAGYIANATNNNSAFREIVERFITGDQND